MYLFLIVFFVFSEVLYSQLLYDEKYNADRLDFILN